MFESMIARHATEQHVSALRRAELVRQVRRDRAQAPAGAVRRGVARHLVAVAGRLDPRAATPPDMASPTGSRRAA